jgi:hypothetical protein
MRGARYPSPTGQEPLPFDGARAQPGIPMIDAHGVRNAPRRAAGSPAATRGCIGRACVRPRVSHAYALGRLRMCAGNSQRRPRSLPRRLPSVTVVPRTHQSTWRTTDGGSPPDRWDGGSGTRPGQARLRSSRRGTAKPLRLCSTASMKCTMREQVLTSFRLNTPRRTSQSL